MKKPTDEDPWAYGEIASEPTQLASAGRQRRRWQRRLLADVGHEGHETRTLDRVFHGPLESGAVAAAFTTEELALARAHLLEALHILVVDEGRPRTTLFRAESAAVLSAPPELLANHSANLAYTG